MSNLMKYTLNILLFKKRVLIYDFCSILQVLWYRDTLQLDMTEWRITDVRGNRYTLRLRKVQKTDFGNYSCVADNGLGKSKRLIEVTGK